MKSKLQNITVILLLLLAGVGLCYLIFNFFDNIMNGLFVDWFEGKFVYTKYGYNSTSDMEYIMNQINWPKLKLFLFRMLLIIVTLCIFIVWAAANVRVGRERKQMVSAAGRMIRDYMHSDREAAEIFPKEYAELSLQLAELRADRQHKEQILKEEAGRKNDLITYLAHDLKTPLTSVIGYLSLLQEAPDMPDAQKAKYIDITLDKALRLERLINEFFEITRYNLQQISIERETINLSYMLVQMADEFYPILNAHGNTVELQVREDEVVYADSNKLARVFNNILKNAVAYSYPDTPVLIRAEKTQTEDGEGWVKIFFQNQGMTIPRQRLDSIFEKFFRLDEARTTNTGGAGLGLAIAKDIITLHGGSIMADSENEVTTFTVALPL